MGAITSLQKHTAIHTLTCYLGSPPCHSEIYLFTHLYEHPLCISNFTIFFQDNTLHGHQQVPQKQQKEREIRQMTFKICDLNNPLRLLRHGMQNSQHMRQVRPLFLFFTTQDFSRKL